MSRFKWLLPKAARVSKHAKSHTRQRPLARGRTETTSAQWLWFQQCRNIRRCQRPFNEVVDSVVSHTTISRFPACKTISAGTVDGLTTDACVWNANNNSKMERYGDTQWRVVKPRTNWWTWYGMKVAEVRSSSHNNKLVGLVQLKIQPLVSGLHVECSTPSDRQCELHPELLNYIVPATPS